MQKINPLHGRTASDHGVATWMGASGDSDGFLSVPASVLAAGSAVAAGWAGSSSYKQQLLQPWSSAPGGLPVSYPATSGSQSTLGQQQLSAPAPESINHAAVLPWFAVVVELLGDIVRLSMHEAEVVLQDSSGDAARASRQRRRFVPEQLLDELELADTALFVLADSLHLQAVYRAGSDQPPKDSSSQPRAVKGQLHVSRSSNQLADERFSGAGSVAGDADQAGITVNIPATMTSMSDVLLTPPADIDRIFTQFNLHKGHVLSGWNPLCFWQQAYSWLHNSTSLCCSHASAYGLCVHCTTTNLMQDGKCWHALTCNTLCVDLVCISANQASIVLVVVCCR